MQGKPTLWRGHQRNRTVLRMARPAGSQGGACRPLQAAAAGSIHVVEPGGGSRRLDCHFAGTPSPSLLKHLLKDEGVRLQQNDSLADG